MVDLVFVCFYLVFYQMGSMDPAKLDEIRRTIYVGNLDSSVRYIHKTLAMFGVLNDCKDNCCYVIFGTVLSLLIYDADTVHMFVYFCTNATLFVLLLCLITLFCRPLLLIS